jgi:hypothetical protein
MKKKYFFQLLGDGEIADINYPLQGVDVIFPHGKAILNNIETIIKNEFQNLSYFEVDVPGIVPSKFVSHLNQYDLFKAQNKKREFYLAGSSEIQTSYLAKQLTKSYKDLPLKVFSISKVRREVDSTSLIKNVEFRMFEINAFFETEEEAYIEINKINNFFKKILRRFDISYINVYEKIDKKIPSVIYTYFPFSKTFGAALWLSIPNDFYTKVVKFSLPNSSNKQFGVVQLNGATTGRILAIYLANHMDKNGFIVNPKISDYSAIIVKNKYFYQNDQIKKEIEGLNFKTKIMVTNKHSEAIKKFYATGIPLLLEPGLHEIKIISRDNLKSFWVKPEDLKEKCRKLLKEFSFKNKHKILLKKISSPDQISTGKDNSVFVVSPKNKSKFINTKLKKIGYLDNLSAVYVKRRY